MHLSKVIIVFQSQHTLKIQNSKSLHYIIPTYNSKEYTLTIPKGRRQSIVRKYWTKGRPKLSRTTPKSCSSLYGVRELNWLPAPTLLSVAYLSFMRWCLPWCTALLGWKLRPNSWSPWSWKVLWNPKLRTLQIIRHPGGLAEPKKK